jgi:hypothetical protein
VVEKVLLEMRMSFEEKEKVGFISRASDPTVPKLRACGGRAEEKSIFRV